MVVEGVSGTQQHAKLAHVIPEIYGLWARTVDPEAV
jgi:hypothetical protein